MDDLNTSTPSLVEAAPPSTDQTAGEPEPVNLERSFILEHGFINDVLSFVTGGAHKKEQEAPEGTTPKREGRGGTQCLTSDGRKWCVTFHTQPSKRRGVPQRVSIIVCTTRGAEAQQMKVTVREEGNEVHCEMMCNNEVMPLTAEHVGFFQRIMEASQSAQELQKELDGFERKLTS